MIDKLFGLITFMLVPAFIFSQVIQINNASFEGTPQDATVPAGWFPCERGTTPDILPGFWGVYQEASEGDTYVGLITREDGTWESIGQRLSQALVAKECYAFTLDIAHSKTYATYNQPLKVRIWAGTTRCERSQLLLETDFIENTDWEKYEVDFTAKGAYHYIIIEAYYKDGNFSRRGNILIDNISSIKKCIRA
ncbi:MAG: hypothetical protein MI974_33105 [Chitinophagales bacterium]|nr:hypothetical protein [Chitinophagales bacterium]